MKESYTASGVTRCYKFKCDFTMCTDSGDVRDATII